MQREEWNRTGPPNREDTGRPGDRRDIEEI